MGPSQHYLGLYVKYVSSSVEIPTDVIYLRMSVRKRVLWDFYLLAVDYV